MRPRRGLLRTPSRSLRSGDYALSLHRFVGGVQLLGGLTLTSAYALGAGSVDLAAAPAVLVAIGLVQLGVGLRWLARPERMRATAKRSPGVLVAGALIAATAVSLLGGSGPDGLWITSTEAWLVIAGALMPRRGLLVATPIAAALTGAAWIGLDGGSGGFDADGNYVIALISLAKVFAIGLWMGSVTGATWALLERWVVIERHERGLIGRLRSQLAQVGEAASTLAARLADSPARSTELDQLRARLSEGVDLPEAGATVSAGRLLDDLLGEARGADLPVALTAEITGTDASTPLPAPVTAALAAVARRQLGNVVRHAPNATAVHLHLAGDAAADAVRLTLADDGGGTAPASTAPGGGTGWSTRQLARIGGSARYFDAGTGVGLEITVPLGGTARMRTAPELSIDRSIDRFAHGLMGALRLGAYVGDSLAASTVQGIGDRWLLMPLGAILIELVLQRGIPGLARTAGARRCAASLLSVALVLAFTVPADSPENLVPASTSVVVPALLLLERQGVAWLVVELARAAAVLLLVVRFGGSVVELVVIYPVAFNLLTYAVRRFLDAARGLERSVLDAFARSALGGVTVHSLALHHDAVDVLLRATPPGTGIDAAGEQLEAAVDDLQRVAAATLDPRETMRTGISVALGVPVDVAAADRDRDRGSTRPISLVGGIDQITLFEIAALAADERASCAPPGLLGRRRLQRMVLRFSTREDGATVLQLAAEPTLAPPDRHKVDALTTVATALGLTVDSAPQELTLVYAR